MEVLANAGEKRDIVLGGIVRRSRVLPDGNELGVEFVPEIGNGQLVWLKRYLEQRAGKAPWSRDRRMNLLMDISVRGNGDGRESLGTMYNVCSSGAAIFLEKSFPCGTRLRLAFTLPTEKGNHEITLKAAVRRASKQTVGTMMAVEFSPDDDSGDYKRFVCYMQKRAGLAGKHANNRGFTLVETSVVLIIICLMATMAAPIYSRAIEHAKAETAAASLRSVWSAQRIYWLENKTFAPSLNALESMDLVTPALAQTQSSPGATYVYQIASADSGQFSATATRNGSGVWAGQFQIGEDGLVTGVITGPGGQQISPGD
jgi:prepilin-type N-terminal cleavage/methylation domain-containing protein